MITIINLEMLEKKILIFNLNTRFSLYEVSIEGFGQDLEDE